MLAYLARYTHRVAISNSRLIAHDEAGVTFTCKDYQAEGRARYKTMTLAPYEFIRRFLIHVLPKVFHRIRQYGLFANGNRSRNIALARQLLAVPPPEPEPDENSGEDPELPALSLPCPECGGRMIIIESFEPGHRPRAPPVAVPKHCP